MKLRLLVVAGAAVLAGCNFSEGERTVFQNADGQVSIVRSMSTISEEGNLVTASCIALPEAFSGDISVLIDGTEYDTENGMTVEFNTVPGSLENTEITSLFPISGYSWHCYSDIERYYVSGNGGTITYTFSPDSDNQLVFTSIGLVNFSHVGTYIMEL